MAWFSENTKEYELEPEEHIIARIMVTVMSQFHQYKRGDVIVVDDNRFTQALIKNGIFVEGGGF